MDKYQRRKGQKLIALFFVGLLIFNYPILTLGSIEGLIWGVPIPYVYIFLTWTILIGLTALVIEQRK